MGDLAVLWHSAVAGNRAPLELALATGSHLPGPRANLELAARFADVAGETAADDRDAALVLLGAWLARPARFMAVISDEVSEFLPACAALAAGALGDRNLLTFAASDPRWRVRELAATGMQRILTDDWSLGLDGVQTWLRSSDPLQVRAAVAAVAEPPLLHDPGRAAQAYGVIEEAMGVLLAVPAEHRRDDDVRVLRKALGYAVSVVTVASVESGLRLLQRLAASDDPDARWVAKENLRKARLKPFSNRLAAAREALELH
ncbi:MAG TPA: hypothetical protein PKE40_09350 [Arachnia sp.]|nr:hypothetical protein [Arachnia sp.]HMT86545.1 hypothetical protein [Arachnia sp.]